jgi:hypothetical protein
MSCCFSWRGTFFTYGIFEEEKIVDPPTILAVAAVTTVGSPDRVADIMDSPDRAEVIMDSPDRTDATMDSPDRVAMVEPVVSNGRVLREDGPFPAFSKYSLHT